MVDNVFKIERGKYNKDVDAPRMKAYMTLVRLKNKAGYQQMTVKQWQAAGCPGSELESKLKIG